MLVSGQGLVLHGIKYGDNNIIATVYTREWGRQAYMVTIPRSRKSASKAGMLQPMFFLNFVAYQKETREVQRIKELKNQPVYQSIPFDLIKSTQAMFLAEMLYKILREHESSPDTYDFIQNSLLYYDLAERADANFHIWFLFRLTEYAGIMPDMTKTGYQGWFDMRKGAVVPFEPPHSFFMNREATEALIHLANVNIGELSQYKLSGTVRTHLTTKLAEYYQLHFDHLGEIKSLRVLHEVFS